ncbi:hypothetical protein SCX11_11685, partial [Bifidobacterium longum]
KYTTTALLLSIIVVLSLKSLDNSGRKSRCDSSPAIAPASVASTVKSAKQYYKCKSRIEA